jgi:tetratricopeptide (TPR) repeat protein
MRTFKECERGKNGLRFRLVLTGKAGHIESRNFPLRWPALRQKQKHTLEKNTMATTAEMYNEAEKLKDDGKYDEAITKLNEVLEQDESHVLSHLALAVLYGRVSQHADAVKHGQRACELDPSDPFNFTAMSVTYQRASQGVDNAQDNQRYVHLAEEAMARAHMLQGQH